MFKRGPELTSSLCSFQVCIQFFNYAVGKPSFIDGGIWELRHGIQTSIEAILACHPALFTEWLGWVAIDDFVKDGDGLRSCIFFCGDNRRIRSMHVLIRPRLLPYRSIVHAKLQDLRPSPSFTKSSILHEKWRMHTGPVYKRQKKQSQHRGFRISATCGFTAWCTSTTTRSRLSTTTRSRLSTTTRSRPYWSLLARTVVKPLLLRTHVRPWPKKKKRPLGLCIKSEHCSYHGMSQNQAWLRFSAAMREVAASHATVPISWHCVIRAVFLFYALSKWPFFFLPG